MISSPRFFIQTSRSRSDRSLPSLPLQRSPLIGSGGLTSLGGDDDDEDEGNGHGNPIAADSSQRTSFQEDSLFSVRPKSSPKVAVETMELGGDPPNIHGWPEKPRTLKSKSVLSTLGMIGGILLSLSPIAFVVLGILAVTLNGQPTINNKLGKDVLSVAQLGPTIFPILFAAVAGRSLKTIARFCAERGAKLGVLELLLASQTVWGTFESQVHLRRLSVVGGHLFVLWSLSPLGGQASLRLVQTNTTSMNTASNVLYLPTGGMAESFVDGGVFAQGDAASGVAATNALFSAMLLAPESVKRSPRDTWGNMKIPRLETIANGVKAADGWTDVPTLSSAENYTTLVGLPMAGISQDANIDQTFAVEHAYMTLDCPVAYNTTYRNEWWREQLGLVWSYDNGSAAFYNNETQTQTSFFLDTNMLIINARGSALDADENATTLADPVMQEKRNVLLGTEYMEPIDVNPVGGYALLLRNCTIEQVYVEARASCNSQGCQVVSLRPSVEYAKRNPNITPLDVYPVNSLLLRNLPVATGSLHDGDAAPSELFIRGADTPFGISSSDAPAMINVTANTFAMRLGVLINTYYQLSLAPLAYTASLPDPNNEVWTFLNGSVYPSDFSSKPSAPFTPVYANATTTTTHEIYSCNYLWLAFMLSSAFILLGVGMVGVALDLKCQAPDMMGYVTSQTYDNPYVRLPCGGGPMSAMERARLLKDVRVKIGDARQKEAIGHVVLATLDSEGSVGALDKTKYYL